MKTIEIYNVRFGIATNSSSSHSMVFVDTPVSDNYIDESFGWEYFTLASKDTKNYMRQQPYQMPFPTAQWILLNVYW